MQSVELDEKEWQQVIAVLAGGPWNVVNPILQKMASQLQGKPNGAESKKAKAPERPSERPQ